MTAEQLIKLAGLALIASGVLVTIGFAAHPHDSLGTNHALWIGSHILVMAGFMAALLGLIGLYAAVARRAGVAGLLGFLLAAVSLVLYLGKLYWSGFIYPLVVAQHPGFIDEFGFSPGDQPVDPLVKTVFYLGPLLFSVGYTLLGWTLLSARVFPALPVRLVVIGALLVGLWPLLPAQIQGLSAAVSLLFAVGIAWIGYLLMIGRYARPAEPVPSEAGRL